MCLLWILTYMLHMSLAYDTHHNYRNHRHRELLNHPHDYRVLAQRSIRASSVGVGIPTNYSSSVPVTIGSDGYGKFKPPMQVHQ
jgi:hypothetical protein